MDCKRLVVACFVIASCLVPSLLLADTEVRGSRVRYQAGAAIGEVTDNQFVFCDNCQKRSVSLGGYVPPSFKTAMPQPQIQPPPAAMTVTAVAPAVEERQKPALGQAPARCQIAMVHFDLDSAVLSSAAEKELKRGIAAAKSSGITRVKVEGYTCRLGDKKHNDALAMERAQTVGRFFEAHEVEGVSRTGFGSCCYVDTENLAMNRRAVVFSEGPCEAANNKKEIVR
jgi:outer membrane protein OmpA-like peptidoglycan-associated protein